MKLLPKVLLIIVLASFMTACSSMKFWESDEVDELEPAKLIDIDEEVNVKKVWREGIGSQDELYSSLKPTLVDGVIYAANDSGDVKAIEAVSGDIIWKIDLDHSLSGGVGVGGGLALVADIEGDIFALDNSSGALLWQTNISHEVLSAPVSNGTEVIIQTLDGYMVGLDAGSGMELWSFRADIPKITLRTSGSPLVVGSMVIGGFANGKVSALNTAKGSLQWESRVALPKGRSELERMVDIAGSPILVGDIVYATSYHGRTAAITRGTGRILWFQDMSSFRQPGYGDDKLFVVLDNDEIKALRSNSGQEMWSNAQMKRRQLSAPAYVNNYMAVGDADGFLHILSATDGRVVGREKVDGSGLSAPIMSDSEQFYVFDNSGDLTAYRIIEK